MGSRPRRRPGASALAGLLLSACAVSRLVVVSQGESASPGGSSGGERLTPSEWERLEAMLGALARSLPEPVQLRVLPGGADFDRHGRTIDVPMEAVHRALRSTPGEPTLDEPPRLRLRPRAGPHRRGALRRGVRGAVCLRARG